MKINGIAHIQLSVRDYEKCLAFYRKLLAFFEMTLIFENSDMFYCVGSKTGVAICRASKEFDDQPFHQRRAGLHHLCFRLYSKEDVDALYEFVLSLGMKIIRAPQEDAEWAPGYYSILFEDPDGIRLEANYVPGKGNLDDSVDLPKKWDISY